MPGRAASPTSGILAVARRIAVRAGCASTAPEHLACALGKLTASPWPEAAWRFSRLTEDGSPVEFTFSSREDALRCAIEVAGPEIDAQDRISEACKLLGLLDEPHPQAEVLGSWLAMQRGAVLNWGAWLGLRHDRAGMRSKLYLEVPRRRQPDVPSPVPGARLLMIGHEPATGRTEYYYRKPALDPADLEALFVSAHWRETRDCVDVLIEELTGMPIQVALRWVGLGFSLARRTGSEAPSLTLFLRAKAARGGAAEVRRLFLAEAGRAGHDGGVYAELLASTPRNALPDHGLVALGVAPDRTVEMRVGISGTALARCAAGHPASAGEPLTAGIAPLGAAVPRALPSMHIERHRIASTC